MKLEAVIFDMDGLLIDSEPVWNKARVAMAANHGYAWSAHDHQAVMGVSTGTWVRYMQEKLGLDMATQAVENTIIQHMVAYYKTEGVPYLPGAVEAVDLARASVPIAIASGSHPALIEAVSSDAALSGKFQVVLSADEVGKGKPEPDVYLEAAKRLGVNPANCLCLEDSGNGILAGKAAGMRVVAVPDERFPPSAEKLAEADIVLHTLEDFTLALAE